MIVSRSNFDETLGSLSRSTSLGIDTETTGLTESDRLFSIIISNGLNSYYFNFKQYPGLDEDLVLQLKHKFLMQEFLLDRPDLTWFISNAKFDMRMLAYEGFVLRGTVFCTNQMGRLLRNDHLTGYGLDASVKRIGYEKDKSVDTYIKQHRLYSYSKAPGKDAEYKNLHFDRVPFEVISKYGESDGHLHYTLGKYLEEELKDSSDLVKTEIDLTKAVFRMERTGIRINWDYVEKAIAYEESLIRECKDRFRAVTGHEYDNTKTTLVKVLEDQGVSIGKTAKGNPSINADVLDSLDGEVPEMIKEIRGREKKVQAFYSSFLHFAGADDVIRPDFQIGGTVTGRFSCRDPNMQQLSKEEDSKETYLVRGCFVPRRGKVFVSIDYKQQEYRLLADYAGDKNLIKEIMSGKDVHQATADLAGISRSHAKTVAFSLLYGSGVDKLAKTLGTTVERARELKQRFFSALPYIEALISRVRTVAKNRGYIKTWTGRKLYLSDPEYSYIMPNHLIQGGCADVMKQAIIKVTKFIDDNTLGTKILLTIHDELVLEMPEFELKYIPEIQAIMENIYPSMNGIKLETDAKISRGSLAVRDMEKYEHIPHLRNGDGHHEQLQQVPKPPPLHH
jgi:DNA polymerase-1